MPQLSDYLELDLTGLEIDSVSWSAPRLTANFGDGYGATALVGSSAGLHRFILSSGALPDAANYGNLINSLPRFEYYFEFIKLHTTTKEIFEISYRDKRYHASFVNNNFDAEMLTYDLFSASGVEIKQRRVEGIYYNTDGSIHDIINLPGIYSWHEARTFSQTGTAWPNSVPNGHIPLLAYSGDVELIEDVINELPVVRFNAGAGEGFVSGEESPVIKEAVLVMKVREANWSNFGGILTADTGGALLFGDSGDPKFFDASLGGNYQYRLNGTIYAAANQQAPMNVFGIVHARFTAGSGSTLANFQVGKHTDFTDRYSKVDIAELILGTSTWTETEVTNLTAALDRKYAL